MDVNSPILSHRSVSEWIEFITSGITSARLSVTSRGERGRDDDQRGPDGMLTGRKAKKSASVYKMRRLVICLGGSLHCPSDISYKRNYTCQLSKKFEENEGYE